MPARKRKPVSSHRREHVERGPTVAKFAALMASERKAGRSYLHVGARTGIQPSQLSRFAAGIRTPTMEQAQILHMYAEEHGVDLPADEWVVVREMRGVAG